MVLSLSDQLSRPCGNAGGTRHFAPPYDDLSLGPVLLPGDGEAAALVLAAWLCSQLAPGCNLRQGPRQVDLPVPARRQSVRPDRFLPFPVPPRHAPQPVPLQRPPSPFPSTFLS